MIKAAPMGKPKATRVNFPFPTGNAISDHVLSGRSAQLPKRTAPAIEAVRVMTLAEEIDEMFDEPKPVKQTVIRASTPAPTKEATLPKAPANNVHPRNAKCIVCHTLMVMNALRPADFGGYQCISVKGCKERMEMYYVKRGEELATAMTTPALAKLPDSETPNGIRVTQPSAKEIANAKLDSLTKPAPLVRVTDEDPLNMTQPEAPIKFFGTPGEVANPGEMVRVIDEPARTDEEIARDVLYNVVDKQGIKWTLCEALQCEGINSIPAHLIAVIADESLESGELPYSGIVTLMGKLAKAARSMGHHSLAFYIAQAYFNDTGKRLAGF